MRSPPAPPVAFVARPLVALPLVALSFVGAEALVAWLAPVAPVGWADRGLAVAITGGLAVLVAGAASVLPPRWRLRAALLGLGLLLGPSSLARADVPALVFGLWIPLVLVRPRLAAAGLVSAGFALLPAGLGLLPAGPVAPGDLDAGPPGPNVVLVTVDTLRADAGLRLPGEWLRFEQAISGAPWTLPAFYSLCTGLPVEAHGGGLPVGADTYTRPAEGPWLSERFAAAGYATRAFVSNGHLQRELGFDRGYSTFQHADDLREPFLARQAWDGWRFRLSGRVSRLRHTRDDRLVDAARIALRGRGQFVWVHLLAPHEYTRDPDVDVPGWVPGTDDPAVLRASYAVNVVATERRIARLLADLPADTLVAVVGDHGEALGEGGHRGHGHHLDDVETRVPLALRGLGPGVVSAQVATWDLGATLLAIAGIDAGIEGPFPGRDLRSGGRSAVAVGGLRRDASAFAERREGGGWTPRTPALAPAGGAALSPRVRADLEAIGYLDDDP